MPMASPGHNLPMHEPTDYLAFEERQKERRIVSTIDVMVAPNVEDAADLS